MVEGDQIRDWHMGVNDWTVFPYDAEFKVIPEAREHPIQRFLWPGRNCLVNSKMFGKKTKVQSGLRWYEFGRLTAHKLRIPRSIVFAAVASHNHFYLDTGGKIFKQSALVIKLRANASLEGDVVGAFQARRRLLAENPSIRLLEGRVYKRPWLGRQGVYGSATSTFKERLHVALSDWLLDRLEATAKAEPEMLSCARLADRMRADADFLRVAELHAGRPDFDLTRLVTDLVRAESVPFLPRHRYRESGLRKRREWEETWDKQRREDAIDAEVSALTTDPKDGHPLTPAEKQVVATERKAKEIGPIAVPQKYKSSDFTETSYWRLRGKLDVPKERFISYRAAERDTDPTPVILWAGFDHLQQATALANYYTAMKDESGWPLPRLLPLLAGLQELIPWLKQWHNEVHPDFQQRMGDFYGDFVADQARALGTTVEGLRELAFGEGQ